ncbi:MAG: hypothetical protein TYPL_2870 [Candidatus Tyloplasma litorale]|nr:MAG: hypothetical protein TYPL_2870 [Mycoplasmatales bacterium]
MENKNDWIDFLLKKAKFNLTDEEKIKFSKDLEIFQEELKFLDSFDLEKIEPLRVPFENQESSLREDENIKNNSKKILENASSSKEGFIFLEKYKGSK